MHKIELVAQGHHCRDWPNLKILLNGQELWNDQVKDLMTISITVPEFEITNVLTLMHYGKQFGDQGTYDTDTVLGTDRGITIKDLKFDGITIGAHKINQLIFQTSWTQHQQKTLNPEYIQEHTEFECGGFMGFNGQINIEFWTPVLEWLTVFKYKVDRQPGLAHFSGFDQRWHYDEDLKLIKEIRELMRFE